MDSEKKTARFVGTLFLTAMVASLLGGGLVDSIISAPNLASTVSENKTQVIIGLLLELVNAIAVIGIAALMFPLLKRYNESMSLGYLGFRIIEAAFCSAIVITPLALIRLSQQYLEAGTMEPAYFQGAGALSIAERASVAGLLIPVFFVMGALLFYSLLHRSKLLPRFISVWGFIAAVLILMLNLLSLNMEIGMSVGMVLALPMILNEIFLGIWLIVKGFNPASEAA
jgi:hypothetical protein